MADGGEKSRRPSDTAFKQQRLPAWQPIFTAGTVLPSFFVIGILFIPIGIGVLFFSENIYEFKLDYTNCRSAAGELCADKINPTSSVDTCVCRPRDIELKHDMHGQVFMYYGLTKFHQNHRRYVKSRDDRQLLGLVGTASDPKEPKSDCEPFNKDNGKIIFPCGAIANSLFSDTIELYRLGTGTQPDPIPLKKEGIAWESDKEHKFKNPDWWDDAQSNPQHPAWTKFTKPRGWSRELWNWTEGVKDEDFIVWMRVAAFPDFRKLYRIVNHANAAPEFQKGLPKGRYRLKINYSFPVTQYKGTKSLILSTTSVLGGKNQFLGFCYIVIGSVCLVLGVLFMFIHLKFGKRNYVQPNENTPVLNVASGQTLLNPTTSEPAVGSATEKLALSPRNA